MKNKIIFLTLNVFAIFAFTLKAQPTGRTEMTDVVKRQQLEQKQQEQRNKDVQERLDKMQKDINEEIKRIQEKEKRAEDIIRKEVLAKKTAEINKQLDEEATQEEKTKAEINNFSQKVDAIENLISLSQLLLLSIEPKKAQYEKFAPEFYKNLRDKLISKFNEIPKEEFEEEFKRLGNYPLIQKKFIDWGKQNLSQILENYKVESDKLQNLKRSGETSLDEEETLKLAQPSNVVKNLAETVFEAIKLVQKIAIIAVNEDLEKTVFNAIESLGEKYSIENMKKLYQELRKTLDINKIKENVSKEIFENMGGAEDEAKLKPKETKEKVEPIKSVQEQKTEEKEKIESGEKTEKDFFKNISTVKNEEALKKIIQENGGEPKFIDKLTNNMSIGNLMIIQNNSTVKKFIEKNSNASTKFMQAIKNIPFEDLIFIQKVKPMFAFDILSANRNKLSMSERALLRFKSFFRGIFTTTSRTRQASWQIFKALEAKTPQEKEKLSAELKKITSKDPIVSKDPIIKKILEVENLVEDFVQKGKTAEDIKNEIKKMTHQNQNETKFDTETQIVYENLWYMYKTLSENILNAPSAEGKEDLGNIYTVLSLSKEQRTPEQNKNLNAWAKLPTEFIALPYLEFSKTSLSE